MGVGWQQQVSRENRHCPRFSVHNSPMIAALLFFDPALTQVSAWFSPSHTGANSPSGFFTAYFFAEEKSFLLYSCLGSKNAFNLLAVLLSKHNKIKEFEDMHHQSTNWSLRPNTAWNLLKATKTRTWHKFLQCYLIFILLSMCLNENQKSAYTYLHILPPNA